MKPSKYYTTFLCILFCSLGFSQEKEFIKGVLLDNTIREPISFATIRVKNKAVGVISNIDGSFRIPLKFMILNDTLQISSMGYDSREIIISDLSWNGINRIYLHPMLVELDEVTLRAPKRRRNTKKEIGLSPTEIIADAIDRIPENYPSAPYSYVGYYRDYQWKGDTYTNLNEAIVAVFDQGFQTSDYELTNTRIYEYWRNPNFPRDSTSERIYDYKNNTKIIPKAYLGSYGGNEFIILRIMDAIRNYDTYSYSYIYRLDTDFLKNHNFLLEDDTLLDGESLYTININKRNGPVSVKGKIYISKDNFKIHKLEYAVYDLAQGHNRSYRKSGRAENSLIFSTLVEYKSHGNKMVPNYISFNNKFEIMEPPIFTVNKVLIDFENKRFEINFNKEPRISQILKNRNYKITYKGRDVKIDSIVVNDKTMVFLYPRMNLGDRSLDIFYSNPNDEFDESDFRIVMENMVDVDGNKLDHSSSTAYSQVREFFVQQYNPLYEYPDDSLFMDRNRPIFQDQPIKKPYNYKDFWMNTPLLDNWTKEEERK